MQTTADTALYPTVGDPAPEIQLYREDGSAMPLSRLWQQGPVVLVFLRHLGCTFCREHVAQLRHDAAQFEELGAVIGLITSDKPEGTAAFCRDLPSPFVCLSDADKQAYRAYGLSRATSQELFAPHIWARGFQAALHGHFNGLPKGDPFQMPGVFIVDRSGIIRYIHRHHDAADNPPNAQLFAVLTQ